MEEKTRNQRYRHLLWGAYEGTTEPLLENAVEGGRDPYWTNVVLLMDFEGTPGGTDADDLSDNAADATFNENVVLATAAAKFGSTGLDCDLAGHVGIPNNADFIPDTSYTGEAWIYLRDTGSVQAIMGNRTGGAQHGWLFYFDATNKLTFVGWGSGDATQKVLAIGDTALSTGQWYHVAFTRTAAGVLNLWVNGVLDGTDTETANMTNTANEFQIGQDITTSANDFLGYIDEIRLTRGVVRYTDTFTPPTGAFRQQ